MHSKQKLKQYRALTLMEHAQTATEFIARFRLKPIPVAVVSMAFLLGAAAPAQAQEQGVTPAAESSEKSLAPITVQAGGADETATGPVTGFVARRALSATKTDTPLLETPQAISVITRDQMEAQGVQTLRQVTAYTAGVVSNTVDSRVDTHTARGGEVTQYQDGLLRNTGSFNTTRPDPYTLERVEFLRGPTSVLYGQGSVGGVLNLTSKRPQAEPLREVQLQLGNYARKQIATDLTGALDANSQWLYRLVAINRDSNTQVNHVNDDLLLVAPSLTWQPHADTSVTLQVLHQKGKSKSLIGFFPWKGTVLANRYGQIPTATFTGEPDWDVYNTENTSVGYLFSHRLNPAWTLRHNLRYSKSDVDYRTLYTSFIANPATGRPARAVLNRDERSVMRTAYWALNRSNLLLADTQLEGQLKLGGVEHTALMGLDAQRIQTAQQTWQTVAPSIDLYTPVYGNFTPPAASALVRQPDVTQRQLGVYVQDQMKWGRWTATLGLRHDSATSSTEGRPAAAADDQAWTKRAGMTYQADGGWAPYMGYAESFRPLGGIDVYGTPFKPTRGQQWEGGVKWQPPGIGLSAFAAAYQLREKNRKTSDPANPLNSLQIGEVKVTGFEAEMTASLARHWDWTLAYAFTDAKIVTSNGGDQGQPVAGVPKHTASTWVSHRFARQGRGGWTLGTGLRYTGSAWSGTSAVTTPSALLADAMLAYDAGDWRLALNVTNLADKVAITSCQARGNCIYGQRRTAVATATYRF